MAAWLAHAQRYAHLIRGSANCKRPFMFCIMPQAEALTKKQRIALQVTGQAEGWLQGVGGFMAVDVASL